MANLHRGEIDAQFGEITHPLCLTLGALAALEQAFVVPDLIGLAARFEEGRLSANDLIKIIGCGLRGAGSCLSDDEVGQLPMKDGLAGYVNIVSNLLTQTFGAFQAKPESPP